MAREAGRPARQAGTMTIQETPKRSATMPFLAHHCRSGVGPERQLSKDAVVSECVRIADIRRQLRHTEVRILPPQPHSTVSTLWTLDECSLRTGTRPRVGETRPGPFLATPGPKVRTRSRSN